MRAPNAGRQGFLGPAFLIGFAFSGLFDAILLHQVLQWHHLLSLVEGEPLRDLRVQVFADGAFHILMYALAAAGLGWLWRRRRSLAAEGSGRRFAGALALGFGAWNVVDVVLFHWVLVIHHIQLHPDRALMSDVLWLAVLGVLPLLVGWRLWRGGRTTGPSAIAAAVIAALVMAGAGAVSLIPSKSPMTAVLFKPGLSDQQIMEAVASVGGRLAWIDRTGDVVVIRLNTPSDGWKLYRHGALLVGGTGPAGCLGWTQV